MRAREDKKAREDCRTYNLNKHSKMVESAHESSKSSVQRAPLSEGEPSVHHSAQNQKTVSLPSRLRHEIGANRRNQARKGAPLRESAALFVYPCTHVGYVVSTPHPSVTPWKATAELAPLLPRLLPPRFARTLPPRAPTFGREQQTARDGKNAGVLIAGFTGTGVSMVASRAATGEQVELCARPRRTATARICNANPPGFYRGQSGTVFKSGQTSDDGYSHANATVDQSSSNHQQHRTAAGTTAGRGRRVSEAGQLPCCSVLAHRSTRPTLSTEVVCPRPRKRSSAAKVVVTAAAAAAAAAANNNNNNNNNQTLTGKLVLCSLFPTDSSTHGSNKGPAFWRRRAPRKKHARTPNTTRTVVVRQQ